jgi:peroxiredoxin
MRLPRLFYLAAATGMCAGAMVILASAMADGPAAAPATQPDQPDPQTLVGKPAPDFKAVGLDGATHSLAEVKGNVVVLDFWATWCVSCRPLLHHLDENAHRLAGRGLKAFAVNAGDAKDAVAKFVADNSLSLPVLLDPDSTVLGAYKGGDELPQTVIIGKDGTVKTVLLGNKADGSTVVTEDKAIETALNEGQ